MAHWLMKSEPSVYAFNHLMNEVSGKTEWNGVRNYQARNFLRDQIKIGDDVLFYHSNTELPAIVGLAKVVGGAKPDSTALDPNSPYFDENAFKKKANPWYVVEIAPLYLFKTPITRSMLEKNPTTSNMLLLKKGSRLSVQPVTSEEYYCILKLSKTS